MNEEEKVESISITCPSTKKTRRFKAKGTKESFIELSENEEAVLAIEDTIKNNTPSTTRLQKEVQKAIDETYKDFREGLKKTILRSLGFSDRWSSGGWEVDHCNGRMNNISNYVKHLTEGFFHTIESETINKVLSEKDKKELANAIRKEVKVQIDYYIRSHIKAIIVNDIKSKTDNLISSMVKEEIDKHSKEIQDVVIEEISTKLEL